MILKSHTAQLAALALALSAAPAGAETPPPPPAAAPPAPALFVDASQFGFAPAASGLDNTRALQRAVDQTGTIVVSQPGTYQMAGTVFIGSNTSLVFGANTFLKKVNEHGTFSHVLVNKGARTKTYDQNISIEGLSILVNGMDACNYEVAYGLRGQLAFFYIKDLRIDRFRCLDLGKSQFCIQVCTFEDISINDVVIKGDKDGVHLGRGKRFAIRNGIFQTYDDAVALNGHDYSSGNPELGWIEDGVIENCHDLADDKKPIGFFCRILAGAWLDWTPGMEVQQSDSVVSNGIIYRVQAKPDGAVYHSVTRPTHRTGSQVIDGINWGVVQTDVTYTAGVRNLSVRNIFLEKPRIGFSVHFDNDHYSRSYYPGAAVPMQQQLTFDNIRVLHEQATDVFAIGTPVDVLTISNSSFRNNHINFRGNKAMTDYLKTQINLYGCVFNSKGRLELVTNSVPNKEIVLKTSSNIAIADDFSASVTPGPGKITVDSDLSGLNEAPGD
ncbi:MAG: hypothetical protein WCJ14_01955 [Verrucomicrobiota bacterium]